MGWWTNFFKKVNEIPKPKYPYKSAQELADKFKGDTYGLGWWIANHIWYKKDSTPADEFRTARQTLELGYGDCDDFAVLAYEVLRCMGVKERHLLTFYPLRGIGHCICQFKGLDGHWFYYDNGEMREGWLDQKQTCEDSAKRLGWSVNKWYKVDIIGVPT